MLMKKIVVALLAVPALATAQTADKGGSADAGSRKIQMCAGCHGIPGWRTAFPEVYGVPKIGGQHAAYIVSALQQYKSGARAHPSMRAIAASLSDQDMADLAAYYSGAPVQQASAAPPTTSNVAPSAPKADK